MTDLSPTSPKKCFPPYSFCLPFSSALFLCFFFLVSFLFSFPFFFFLWYPPSALLFTGQQAWLAQPLSLLLHACCSRHPALSFLAARPIWPGFMVREGGPSHFESLTKLHSNSPKALLNILQQVSLSHSSINSTKLIPQQPTRRRHVATWDSDTWQN